MKTVILASGFGSRLWPLSISGKPKQFQTLFGQESLLQHTYKLFSQVTDSSELYIMTLHGLEHWVYEQLPEISKSQVILTPERRNTLPHILFALNSVAESSDEPILFTGSDNLVFDTTDFKPSVTALTQHSQGGLAKTNRITLACHQTTVIDPALGYLILGPDNKRDRFVEKPNKQELQKLMAKHSCYKFPFTFVLSKNAAAVGLESLADKKLVGLAKKLLSASPDSMQSALLNMPIVDTKELFEKAPNIYGYPIDYDSMDIGSYPILWQINSKDDSGNAIIGDVVLGQNCRDNLVINQTDKPLMVLDTSNSVVIQTPDGTLCSPMPSAAAAGELYKTKIHKQQY
ncbi:MAG TPA: sugar phosphate nucleotidyltransferase [Patescibacteria group bacterium]|nr:sugar phosphate nucleotidyltransferase [Patescibacteria group bacterium]